MVAGIMATRRRAVPQYEHEQEIERRSLWRYVPVTVIMFLISQTGLGVWWASSVTSNQNASTEASKTFQENVKREISDLKLAVYTRAEAALLQQNITARNLECDRRVGALETRVQNHIEHDAMEHNRK